MPTSPPTPRADPDTPASPSPCRIATAGWAIPRASTAAFPTAGTGLARYAARFDAVEINSTFYRSHQSKTYERWAASTPDAFRFALKLPQSITHKARLSGTMDLVTLFRRETGPLGEKRGPLLVQLPPSLAFSREGVDRFFGDLRGVWPEPVVCEPRHPSWFDGDADALLAAHRVGRVAADPAPHPDAASPGGWSGLAYWRLHGAPRMYFSPYDTPALQALARGIVATQRECWCVFDNTASGAAAANALSLQALL